MRTSSKTFLLADDVSTTTRQYHIYDEQSIMYIVYNLQAMNEGL